MREATLRNRRDRRLAALPALLLAGVALGQIHLVRAEQLSPWQGGGFGMFSTTDTLATRDLRVYVRRGARAQELALPAELVDEAERARTLPTERRLEAFGRRAVEVAELHAGPPAGVRGVLVEVWRRRFAAEDLEPRPVRLRSVEVTFGGDGR